LFLYTLGATVIWDSEVEASFLEGREISEDSLNEWELELEPDSEVRAPETEEMEISKLKNLGKDEGKVKKKGKKKGGKKGKNKICSPGGSAPASPNGKPGRIEMDSGIVEMDVNDDDNEGKEEEEDADIDDNAHCNGEEKKQIAENVIRIGVVKSEGQSDGNINPENKNQNQNITENKNEIKNENKNEIQEATIEPDDTGTTVDSVAVKTANPTDQNTDTTLPLLNSEHENTKKEKGNITNGEALVGGTTDRPQGVTRGGRTIIPAQNPNACGSGGSSGHGNCKVKGKGKGKGREREREREKAKERSLKEKDRERSRRSIERGGDASLAISKYAPHAYTSLAPIPIPVYTPPVPVLVPVVPLSVLTSIRSQWVNYTLLFLVDHFLSLPEFEAFVHRIDRKYSTHTVRSDSILLMFLFVLYIILISSKKQFSSLNLIVINSIFFCFYSVVQLFFF
jgi:hypothetical protein